MTREFMVATSRKNKKAFEKRGFKYIDGVYRIVMFKDGNELERVKSILSMIKKETNFSYTIAEVKF